MENIQLCVIVIFQIISNLTFFSLWTEAGEKRWESHGLNHTNLCFLMCQNHILVVMIDFFKVCLLIRLFILVILWFIPAGDWTGSVPPLDCFVIELTQPQVHPVFLRSSQRFLQAQWTPPTQWSVGGCYVTHWSKCMIAEHSFSC